MRSANRFLALAAMAALAAAPGCGTQGATDAACNDVMNASDTAAAPGVSPRRSLMAVNVRLTGKVERKYPNIQKVLDQLILTFDDAAAWGTLWTEKIPLSGAVNWTSQELAAELKKYLTNGTLEISFHPDDVGDSRLSAATKSKSLIRLHSAAGNIINETSIYTDYRLARTIFHELMHVLQYTHWNVVGRFMDYEGFPTAHEPKLPTKHFSQAQTFDPHGAGPVPPVIAGTWHYEGEPDKPCTIAINLQKGAERGRLDVVASDGEAGSGYYVEPDRFEITFPKSGKLTGTVSPGGQVIQWSNYDKWLRGVCKAPAPAAPTGNHHGPGGSEF